NRPYGFRSTGVAKTVGTWAISSKGSVFIFVGNHLRHAASGVEAADHIMVFQTFDNTDSA
ncbi:MAG: hypothetical protein ACN6OP_21485, partial [Pseudomonadales bacterium]